MTKTMPKAELHCHIEGATPPALAAAQAERYGIDTSGFIKNGEYAWQDFTSFVQAYDATANLFRTEEDYALLAETYLCEILAIIGRDVPARQSIARMRTAADTFKYMRQFFAEMRRNGRALPL